MHHIQESPGGKGFSNGHNTRYGAIELRQAYSSTLLKSLLMMCTGVVTIVTIALYFRNDPPPPVISGQTIFPDSVYTIPIDLEPEPPEPKREPAPRRETASGANTEIVAVSDTATERQETLAIEHGDTAVASAGSPSPGNGLTSAGTGTPAAHVGDPNGTGLVRSDWEVNELPEFEGGLPALYRFIKQQTRYPERERIEGRQGSVYVRFIVDENGTVSNVTLLNKAGEGFDQEALRVVKLLPKFKSPAKVNGRPVKVYYQLPITFRVH